MDSGVATELPPRAQTSTSVDVWYANLEIAMSRQRLWWQLLSPDERERALRYRFPIHRDRFIATRGLLRKLLGHYLGIDPAGISFSYTKHGKPFVREAVAWRFNLSHSGDLALFALCSDCEVGVDIEEVRFIPNFEALCALVFNSAELSAIQALPEQERLRAFFAGWTQKEAYLKADGTGLSRPLHDVSVSSLAPTMPPRLLAVAGCPLEAAHWSLCTLRRPPNFIGALAVRAEALRIHEYDIEEGLLQ